MTYPEGLTRTDGATAADRVWAGLLRARDVAVRPFVRARHGWRSSLYLRVVLTTLALSLVVLIVLAQFLLGRVTDGLLNAKERSALDEARAGLAQAQLLADASERGGAGQESKVALVDGIARQLANRAGNPSIYEVLLLGSPSNAASDVPEFGSNQVSASSVPLALREAVRQTSRQSSTYTEIAYADDRPAVPGFAVGAPLALPDVGAYELYYLFPLSQEANTLSLVKRTLAVAGIALVLLLGGIAWLVTRQVVSPVRMAARTAERFSAGRLEERMAVVGEDDLAKLATSFNQMAGSLQGQIRQLEDLSRVQRRFVSDVSHELRTPLTTVRMAADVLHDARQDFDPATARSAELLQNQLDRFELLLTDLLEISRYDAGAAVLEAEPVDLVEVARRSLEAAEPLAERKGSELSLEAPTTGCIAEVDSRRVARILSNLVINAIEHGEGRPVVVTVAADRHAVGIAVRDHGVGLRPGESALVFNRFWRADPARARSTGGTGPRARHRPGGRPPARRLAAGLGCAGRRLQLPAHAAPQVASRPRQLAPAARARGCSRRPPGAAGRGSAGPEGPMRRSRPVLAVAVVAAVAALTGCASIPTSGPVEQRGEVRTERDDPFVRVLAKGPSEGMTQMQIVEGFLRASASFDDDHAVARLFLAPEAVSAWDPTQGAVVYSDDAERAIVDADGNVLELRAREVADISPRGEYTAAAADSVAKAPFALRLVDGQWRIADLPGRAVPHPARRRPLLPVLRPLLPRLHLDAVGAQRDLRAGRPRRLHQPGHPAARGTHRLAVARRTHGLPLGDPPDGAVGACAGRRGAGRPRRLGALGRHRGPAGAVGAAGVDPASAARRLRGAHHLRRHPAAGDRDRAAARRLAAVLAGRASRGRCVRVPRRPARPAGRGQARRRRRAGSATEASRPPTRRCPPRETSWRRCRPVAASSISPRSQPTPPFGRGWSSRS